MNPLDIALFKSIANNPKVVMRQLLSPSVDLSPEWISTPVIKRCLQYTVELSLRDMPITWLTLLAGVPMSEDERKELASIWREGQQSISDWQGAIDELKTRAVKDAAEKSIGDYHSRVRYAPAKVREHLGVLGLEISVIANDGAMYDPRPSSHMADKSMEMRGTWGDSTLNSMFSRSQGDVGGFPSYSFIIASMPTGQGKSTLAVTLTAFALAFNENLRVVIMSNELPRKMYSYGVLRALREIYAGQQSDEALLHMIDGQLSVYAPSDGMEKGYPVDTFEKMRQIVFWERPSLAVIDSISGITPPQFSMNSRYTENSRHEVKANATRDMCLEFGTVLYAPANMSQDEQAKLIKNPLKCNTVMVFGSKAYENAADLSLLGWRDTTNLGIQWLKRCKNRHGQTMGEAWPMQYDYKGSFYRTTGATNVI